MRPTSLVLSWTVTCAIAASLGSESAAVETILKNDGFSSGQPVAFQGGFIAGEMAASRFVPPGPGSWRLNRVQLLFGGAPTTEIFVLRIYDDAAATYAPGAELFSQSYALTGSNTDLQEIVLIADNVTVGGQFRAAIEFQHDGPPSVASDQDGTINSSKNYLFASGLGWYPSSLFGVSGDWVIRAGVEQILADVGDLGAPALAVALAGANPSRDGHVRVRLTLPTDAPARLDLLDVSGRRVDSQDVGSLGAGRHDVDLSARPLAPGVYVVQLTQGMNRCAARVVVTR